MAFLVISCNIFGVLLHEIDVLTWPFWLLRESGWGHGKGGSGCQEKRRVVCRN